MQKLSAKFYVDDKPICLDYRFPWKRNKKRNTHTVKGKIASPEASESESINFKSGLSRENLLRDYLTLIKKRNFNWFGTITSKYAKSETYFRNILIGNKGIRKHNTTDLPEHILNKIIRKQRLYKRQGQEPPTFLEFLDIYKEQIDFYQKGQYVNQHNIKSNIFDTPYKEYKIDHALEASGVNTFFGVLEYGKINGNCHLHFLLHHDDIENVYPKYRKNYNTGTWDKRFITTSSNKLQGLFRWAQSIGSSDLQLIENQEASINYISKYLFKQDQGFGINRPEPLNEHKDSCYVYGNGFVIHSKGHKDGYCEQIYKGSYKDGKQKQIDMPVNRFIDINMDYLQEKQLNLM